MGSHERPEGAMSKNGTRPMTWVQARTWHARLREANIRSGHIEHMRPEDDRATGIYTIQLEQKGRAPTVLRTADEVRAFLAGPTA